MEDLQHLCDFFDFSNLKKIHTLFSKKTKKTGTNSKKKLVKNVFRDEFICLGSKNYSFKLWKR